MTNNKFYTIDIVTNYFGNYKEFQYNLNDNEIVEYDYDDAIPCVDKDYSLKEFNEIDLEFLKEQLPAHDNFKVVWSEWEDNENDGARVVSSKEKKF